MNILDAIGNIKPRALTKDSILNFAYGSNMLGARILQRIPGAKLVGRGILRSYELKWHKVGQDGSGKCDVVSVNDRCSVVHGVVYALSSHEKELLDRFEGLGSGYDERNVEVEMTGTRVSAWIYHATNIDSSLLPFTWYRALVAAGAREHGLPAEYVGHILAVSARDDDNEARARSHFALCRDD